MTSKKLLEKTKMTKAVHRDRLWSNLNEWEMTKRRVTEVYGQVKYWRKNAQASCEKSVGKQETSEKKQQPHLSKKATGKMSKN